MYWKNRDIDMLVDIIIHETSYQAEKQSGYKSKSCNRLITKVLNVTSKNSFLSLERSLGSGLFFVFPIIDVRVLEFKLIVVKIKFIIQYRLNQIRYSGNNRTNGTMN